MSCILWAETPAGNYKLARPAESGHDVLVLAAPTMRVSPAKPWPRLAVAVSSITDTDGCAAYVSSQGATVAALVARLQHLASTQQSWPHEGCCFAAEERTLRPQC